MPVRNRRVRRNRRVTARNVVMNGATAQRRSYADAVKKDTKDNKAKKN